MTHTRLAALAAAATLVAVPLVAPDVSATAAATSSSKATGKLARPFDFNGDGRTDLAVGVPGESVGGGYQAGAVQVLYGAKDGVTTKAQDFWSQTTKGVPGTSELDDHFGYSLASGDFNRDGYADLAIAVPGEDYGHGAVQILYGSKSGLTTAGQQRLTPQNIPSNQSATDNWGLVASGDMDGDGYPDLVIEGSLQNFDGVVATVILGGPHGLNPKHDHRLVVAQTGGVRPSIATGDVDGDGTDELAVGIDDAADWGEVDVISGVTANTPTTTTLRASSSDLAVPGVGWGQFGLSVGFGDFDGDGHADLVVGDPAAAADRTAGYCDPNGRGCYGGGAVLVVPGSASGLRLADRKAFFQGAAGGVPGATEANDEFGWSVAAGDLNGDGRDDLAIGVPGESHLAGGLDHGAGDVAVVYGSATGLTGSGSQRWSELTKGVPGAATSSESYGNTVQIGQFGHGHYADLAAGVPQQKVGAKKVDAGGVSLVYGSSTGLVSSGAQLWTQATKGVTGTPEQFDEFGHLGTGR